MIILSQDKTNIFNFDNITQIFLGYIEENGECSINCETVKGEIEILGTYSSSKRAKEIFAEIIAFYTRNEDKNKVFRMLNT